ncbi:hypothetical protein MXMO3_01806 [Maritalea myrionectae]|uniref:Uncharacterized protein n=1 Tax=Maritalea myrionectae TaxID=454601 RepID=A0A2R4ME65_9HYPH|nr:hypothetical protein [Maritalea myrionectae]AVX04331.1 hypothetical protein MXMO3_01806 [Maritalea myrionectae]
MMIGRVRDATRVLGKSQGYLGLPVRDEIVNDGTAGMCTSMVTAWYPSVEELKALVNGAPVHLRVLGAAHPPVKIEVGPEPEPLPKTEGVQE